MREKLIELLCKAEEQADKRCDFAENCDRCPANNQSIDCLDWLKADCLIALGVTIPVRCKDCKKWYRHTLVDRERGDCRRYQTTKHESGFCDKGERRTDDERTG